jgi:hypothetical protein
MASTLAATRAEYKDLIGGLQSAVRDIALARSDSVIAAEKLAVVRLTVLATQDSARQETIDWKRGALESHVGAANWRMNAARTGVLQATERIEESTRVAASMRAQMKRDSIYIAGFPRVASPRLKATYP